MIKVSATKLQKHLFDYLNKAATGEIIIIERHNREVARLIGVPEKDWRSKVTMVPTLLVSPEEIVKPIADISEPYV